MLSAKHIGVCTCRAKELGVSPNFKLRHYRHPGELVPRVGFIVTNLSRPAERVVAFYNQRGTAEQWIKEGKGAIEWTRLSCRTFAANAVRLQLHALAYNLGNFLRTLATPEPIKTGRSPGLREKLIKIGTRLVSHGRYVAFQMAEVVRPTIRTQRRGGVERCRHKWASSTASRVASERVMLRASSMSFAPATRSWGLQKARVSGLPIRGAVIIAVGVDSHGRREVLGLVVGTSEPI